MQGTLTKLINQKKVTFIVDVEASGLLDILQSYTCLWPLTSTILAKPFGYVCRVDKLNDTLPPICLECGV